MQLLKGGSHLTTAGRHILLRSDIPIEDLRACNPADDGGLCVTGDGSYGCAESGPDFTHSGDMLTVAVYAGDITATSEASKQPVKGLLYDSRISGGILADGFNGLLSALCTNAPLSIFAQNAGGHRRCLLGIQCSRLTSRLLGLLSGVVALTRCANRQAGYVCACLSEFGERLRGNPHRDEAHDTSPSRSDHIRRSRQVIWRDLGYSQSR